MLRAYRSICLSCLHLATRAPYRARRCALQRPIVLNAAPAACPAFSPTEEPTTEPPNQLDLFAQGYVARPVEAAS